MLADLWHCSVLRIEQPPHTLRGPDLAGFRESQGDWSQCFYDPEMLFNAVHRPFPFTLSLPYGNGAGL
eukprot:1401072-Rhodomonas_salina.3